MNMIEIILYSFLLLMLVLAIYKYYKENTSWGDDYCVLASMKLLDIGYFRFYFMG